MGVLSLFSGKAMSGVEDSPEYLIQFVNNEFKRREEERRPYEVQWRLNIAFMEGNQYVEINPMSLAIEEVPKLYWWQNREVFNHVSPIIETRIAKLTRMRPILKTRPGTDDQEDIRAAKVESQLLKNTYNDEGVQNKMSELYAWMESCGSAFFKHTWNITKGPIVAQVQTEDGSAEAVREGDLDIVVVPPQEIYPDSCYRNGIETCRSLIHARAYHVDEIAEIWGQEVSPENTTAMHLQKSMIGTGGLGYGMGGFHYVATSLKNHAIVKEYWETPSKRYPKGRFIVVAGGKLLYSGDLPYPVGEDGQLATPFTKVDCIKRPGCFWGRSVIERLIPIQRSYNALRNRKTEYLNRCAIGQYLVEDGAIDLDVLEQDAGAPGAILVYNKGFAPPKMADNPQLPVAFETEENTLLQEFSMISGVSELSRQSQAPPGVKSGVALSIALEQDDTRLSTTANNIEQFLIDSGKIWLRILKNFVRGARVLRAIGKNNTVELIDWTASDIRSEDVVIEAFSALAESPAQRRQMVFDLLEAGLFMDPDTGRISKETQAKIFEIIEMGNWESGDSEEELHISKAERENRAMQKGSLPVPVNYDDHVLHINRHNKFRLTTDYEELVSKFPQLEQIFQAHVGIHVQMMAQQMAAMQSPAQEPATKQP